MVDGFEQFRITAFFLLSNNFNIGFSTYSHRLHNVMVLKYIFVVTINS